MTDLTWRQQAEAAFRSALDGTRRVTGSPWAGQMAALRAALDVAEPLIREHERFMVDSLSLGGMSIEVAVYRAATRLGIGRDEPSLRLLRDLYRAGVVAGVDIWKLSGDPEPEQVSAVRASERDRIWAKPVTQHLELHGTSCGPVWRCAGCLAELTESTITHMPRCAEMGGA